MTDTAFSLARRIMREEVHKDDQLLHTYKLKVADLLADSFTRVNFQEPEWRNRAAKEIFDLIFDIKPARIHYSKLVNEEPEFEKSGS